MKKIAIVLWVLVAVIFTIYLIVPADTVDLSEAKTYKIVKETDFSFPGRTRLEYKIVAPDAQGFNDRAHSTMRAALDMQADTGANVIYIYMLPGQNGGEWCDYLAICRYVPDGGGNSGKQSWTWQVEASSQTPGPNDIKISALWSQHRGQFQTKEGYTDEPKLRAFIADKISANINDVHLPTYSRKSYTINSES